MFYKQKIVVRCAFSIYLLLPTNIYLLLPTKISS